MDFNINYMTLYDLEEIKNILTNEFDDFWNYSILKDELNSKNSIYFVIRNKDNEITSFGGMKIILDEAEIMDIVTKKIYRNQGFCNALLNRLIVEAKNKNIKRLNLEVNESNEIAIHLYKKLGFIENGRRKNYYRNEDAILMSKKIEN